MVFPLGTAAESSLSCEFEAVLTAPDNPWGMDAPPYPAFRTSANNQLLPRTAAHRPFAVATAPGFSYHGARVAPAAHRPFAAAADPGLPRWASWSSLAGCPQDPSRAAGWVRAPVREMRARWLTISRRGWARIGLRLR